jgi:hypothetical protein
MDIYVATRLGRPVRFPLRRCLQALETLELLEDLAYGPPQRIDVIREISISLLELIKKMGHLTELARWVHYGEVRSGVGLESVTQALILGRNEVQHALLSLPTSQQEVETFFEANFEQPDLAIQEILRLAAMLFNVMSLFPMPGRTGVKSRLAKRMHAIWIQSSFARCEQGTEVELLELKIWILWFGCLGAPPATYYRDWFEAALYDQISLYMVRQDESMNYEKITNLLRGILWFEPTCDRLGRDLWSRVSFG